MTGSDRQKSKGLQRQSAGISCSMIFNEMTERGETQQRESDDHRPKLSFCFPTSAERPLFGVGEGG